jgi:hypothetical protein
MSVSFSWGPVVAASAAAVPSAAPRSFATAMPTSAPPSEAPLSVDRAGPDGLPSPDHGAAADLERAPFEERARDRPVGRLEDARERRARHPHPAGGLLLVEPFDVGEAESLEPVEGEGQPFEPVHGDPLGLEGPGLESGGHLAGRYGARHRVTTVMSI